jgi:hypothetical protein
VVELPAAPQFTDTMVVEGTAIYDRLRCSTCHGLDGKGKGPAAETLMDDWGNPIRVYDFTRRRRYKCGGEDQDLYRTLHTGLTGSPMPSFSEAFAFGSETSDPASRQAFIERRTWSLIAYLRSLESP